MEPRKIIVFSGTLLLLLSSVLQSNPAIAAKRMFMPAPGLYAKQGILRFQGTISAGYMTGFKALDILLHGDVEYYISDRISVRSDIYYSLAINNNDDVPPFKFNHSLFTGIQYHFLNEKPIDFYVGFQPGVSYSKRRYAQFDETGVPPALPQIKSSVNPLVSFNTGLTWYGERFFNAFVHVRYLMGYHQDNYTTASLNELRISFGLGFYIRTLKYARYDYRKRKMENE